MPRGSGYELAKPRPPAGRPPARGFAGAAGLEADDSDDESLAFVVPSRHGSPSPSPRVAIVDVGKDKPRPPPGRPPSKRGYNKAAVEKANAMWNAMETDPNAGPGPAQPEVSLLGTGGRVRLARRDSVDSLDDYVGAQKVDDFPADDETTANAFVVPARKRPISKNRAPRVAQLSSDDDSSLSDSDASGAGFVVPSKHAQPSRAAIERARRASRDSLSKPSSQAVERARAAAARARQGHKPAPPKGPAPPMARPAAPLSVATTHEKGLARKDSWRDVHTARGPPSSQEVRRPHAMARPPRGPPPSGLPRTASSSSMLSTQQNIERHGSSQNVLARADSFREPGLVRKGSFRQPPPRGPRPPGRPATSPHKGRGPATPSHAALAAAQWAGRKKGPSGAQALVAAEQGMRPPPRGMLPPGMQGVASVEPPKNWRELREAAPARAQALREERPQRQAPPPARASLADARAARLAAQHAGGGGNKRRKVDEDEPSPTRVAMRRPVSPNAFDADLGGPWRDPAPGLALTRHGSARNLVRASSAVNIMGLEEPLLRTVARDLARQNSSQDVLARQGSSQNVLARQGSALKLDLPDRVAISRAATAGAPRRPPPRATTPAHRAPPAHPPPRSQNQNRGPPSGPPPGHALHPPGRAPPSRAARAPPPTPKGQKRPAAPAQPPGFFDTGEMTRRSSGRAPPPREGRPPPSETALVKKPTPSLNEDAWACPLCTFKNNADAEKCSCCSRAKTQANKAAERLWAGPPAKLDSTGRPPPPPKPRAAQLIDNMRPSAPEEDALATKRRLMYYRKKPPPKRPRYMRAPGPPSSHPPAHALPPGVVYKESPRRKKHRRQKKPHAVQSKHFTSNYNKTWEDARASRPLSLRETADRGFSQNIEGVVLNELRDIGGVPCGITVIQKEWRAVVHAVDLERGDEYSASSELHARYVEAAAPTPLQKLALYRELVDACAFRSTLEKTRMSRQLKIMPSPRLSAGQKQGGRVCVLRERLVVSGSLVEVSARARSKPDVVELRLRDPASNLTASLSFPLVSAPRLAHAAHDSHVVKVRERLLSTEHLDWETPWAMAAAARAQPAHPGDAVEPSRDLRATVAMAVEYVCGELDMSMVDENRKTSLKLKPSPVLVAQIAEGCRHARAATVLQSAFRGFEARSPEGRAAKAERMRRDASIILQAMVRKRLGKRRFAIRLEGMRRERRRVERIGAIALQSIVRQTQAVALLKQMRYLRRDAARAKKVAAITLAKMRDRERRAAQLAIYRTARARRQLQRWSRAALKDLRRWKREERLRRIAAAQAQAEADSLERKTAAIAIGRMLRGWKAQRLVTRLLWEKFERERDASTTMQCSVRCAFARKEFAQRDFTRRACRAIQSLWRGAQLRAYVRRAVAADAVANLWRTCSAKRLARVVLERRREELLVRARQVAADALDADRRHADAEAARRLSNKTQQERAMAVIKAMRCASESAVITRRRRASIKELVKALKATLDTKSASIVQCFLRRLLARAELKRRIELKKALGIAAMVRRRQAEREAKENRITAKKKKRANARKALVRFQSLYRAHRARSLYLVTYGERRAAIHFQGLIRRSQAKTRLHTLRAKRVEFMENTRLAGAALVFQGKLRRRNARQRLLMKRFVRDDRVLAEKTAQRARAELERLWQEAEVERLREEAAQLEREIREAEENEIKAREAEARKLRELKEHAKQQAILEKERREREAVEAKLREAAEELMKTNAARVFQATERGRQLRNWLAWEHQKAEEVRLAGEAQNDLAWKEWGASLIQAWYRRIITLHSEENERGWNYWAASIVQTWYRGRLAISNIEAANAMWQRQQQQKEEQRVRMASVAEKARAREAARNRAQASSTAWNKELQKSGDGFSSRVGSPRAGAAFTPGDGFLPRVGAAFSPRGGLNSARSDTSDEGSVVTDAGRFVGEFDAQDATDVAKLFRCVRHGRRDAIRQYTEKGCDVNIRNKHGHTLAMVAAQNNQKAILKQLYRFGVEVNEQDYKGNTALHYAQLYGYTALAEYMISKLGADETLINKDGASCWVSVEEATEAAD